MVQEMKVVLSFWIFFNSNYTFKVKWLRNCLLKSDSIWFFIPYNIFKKIGGLNFLLLCDYSISKLPVTLSNFYQQALKAWKLCYVHNFSPHKAILWNNAYITVNRKSLYFQRWKDKGIYFLSDLLDQSAQFLSYETFMNKWAFPIKYREYYSVIKAVPSGLMMLMRSHMSSLNICRSDPVLYLNGVDFNMWTLIVKNAPINLLEIYFIKIGPFSQEGNFSGTFASQRLSGKKLGCFHFGFAYRTNIEK